MQGIKRAHWELKRKQAYGVWDIFNASKDSVARYYISMLDIFGNGDEGIFTTPLTMHLHIKWKD
jgi:hypothetical protein